MPPLSYRDAYAQLSRIAAELETGEADLDRVLPLLEEARDAYAACQSRIEAVRAVLTSGGAVPSGEEEGEGEEDAEDGD